MPFRPIDQATLDLQPYFEDIVRHMDEAHAFFLEEARKLAPHLGAGTKAAVIRDLIIRRMREFCEERAGAQLIKKGNLAVIGLLNNWVVRVKQLRGDFTVAVSPTGASHEYDRNEVPESLKGELPFEPPATCIYLGWTVPENAPERIEKFLVCNRQNGSVGWVIPLDDYSTPPPAALDLPDPSQPPPGEERRVRVRAERRRKSNE